MNPMLPLYVTVSNFVQSTASTVRRRYADNDKGAPLIEYVALLFVVALIVAALHAAHIDTTVRDKATDVLKKIFQ